MNISKLIRYFLLPVYNPVKSLKSLLKNKHRLTYSVVLFLFLGIIYTISVQLAYMKGLGAAVEPFIKITAKDYYFWQRFYQIPFFFITSIIFAGIVRLLSAVIKGKGSFEDLFSIICVSQTLPMLITLWFPETVNFLFFPGKRIMPIWLDIARQVIGIVWPLSIAVIGITINEKIKWYESVVITVIAAVPMVLLIAVFIR
jgi:hypothetical protein